jgi:hypothetical protein
MKGVSLNVLLLALCIRPGFAQLAITEVMSSTSTNLGTLAVINGPDFWELTNFGTNAVNLDGYRYSDSLRLPLVPLPALTVQPGESVVFVRTDPNTAVTDEAQFRAWWGACLSSAVQVRMVPRNPGFDAQSDGVRIYDSATNLLDRVDFGIARRGTTFMYDTNSAEFGIYSQVGVCGACKAELADDIGSPGVTCGPVPLRILAQPTNAAVCAGMDATFVVKAGGLPRPSYQWFFNSNAIPGAVGAALIVTNATPVDAGAYEVEVNNGMTVLRSTMAVLAVSTTPIPPTIVANPLDAYVITGQTARFSATVCAYPLATYQWRSNGVSIAEATNRTLMILNCALSMSGIEYCVEVQNSLGMTSICARLTVTPAPRLEVTEVMALAFPDCVHEDWFEVTNRGTNGVNLLGYRFADRFTLEGSRVVSEPVVVNPGQSAIFVERMSADEFRRWWGAERLPPGLPIITYVGLGFSDQGDELYLWSPGAEDEYDPHTISMSYAGVTPGVSIDFSKRIFAEDSVAGHGGAFVAAECGDVGSPGYLTNPPPRFVTISREGTATTLRWRAIVGRTYQLSWKEELAAAGWTVFNSRTAEDWVETAIDVGNASQRFYLIEEQP